MEVVDELLVDEVRVANGDVTGEGFVAGHLLQNICDWERKVAVCDDRDIGVADEDLVGVVELMVDADGVAVVRIAYTARAEGVSAVIVPAAWSLPCRLEA